ncbi:MAG: hypothetical protein U0804_19080 [Gemmataceae bacterium]
MSETLNRGLLVGLRVYAVASLLSAVAFWLWPAVTGVRDATVDLPRGPEVMYTESWFTQLLVTGVVGLLGGLPFAGVWTILRRDIQAAAGMKPPESPTASAPSQLPR